MGVVGEYPGILSNVQWGISESEGTARTLAFAVAGRLSVYD